MFRVGAKTHVGSGNLKHTYKFFWPYQQILPCVIPSTFIRPFANLIIAQVVIQMYIYNKQMYVFCPFNTTVIAP